MPELRRDPFTGRWTLLAPERARRPSDLGAGEAAGACPFCEGNEAQTPPEIASPGRLRGAADEPGWRVRVVPNRYPAVIRPASLRDPAAPPFLPSPVAGAEVRPGLGAHEVVVETPDHAAGLGDLSREHLVLLLRTLRDRVRALEDDGRFPHVLVFRNQGRAAGATLSHPHTQILALPVPNAVVELELAAAARHAAGGGGCPACTLLAAEEAARVRLVAADDAFVTHAPFASRVPFEIAVHPRAHEPRFSRLTDDLLPALAEHVGGAAARLARAVGDPPYNLVVHTAPPGGGRDAYHWHVEILPRTTAAAGWEMGSGHAINVVTPEAAAAALRSA